MAKVDADEDPGLVRRSGILSLLVFVWWWAAGGGALIGSLLDERTNGAFLATVNQPWPEILDTVTEDLTTYQKSGDLPKEKFQAVDVTVVNAANASTITPSDKLG